MSDKEEIDKHNLLDPDRTKRLSYIGPVGATRNEQEVIDKYRGLVKAYYAAIDRGDYERIGQLSAQLDLFEWFDHDIFTLAMDIEDEYQDKEGTKQNPRCPTCNLVILDGETVRWDKVNKVVYHGGCYPKELAERDRKAMQ